MQESRAHNAQIAAEEQAHREARRIEQRSVYLVILNILMTSELGVGYGPTDRVYCFLVCTCWQDGVQ